MISLVRGVRGFNWTTFRTTVTLINGGDPSTMITDQGRSWPSRAITASFVATRFQIPKLPAELRSFIARRLPRAHLSPFVADFYRPPLSANRRSRPAFERLLHLPRIINRDGSSSSSSSLPSSSLPLATILDRPLHVISIVDSSYPSRCHFPFRRSPRALFSSLCTLFPRLFLFFPNAIFIDVPVIIVSRLLIETDSPREETRLGFASIFTRFSSRAGNIFDRFRTFTGGEEEQENTKRSPFRRAPLPFHPLRSHRRDKSMLRESTGPAFS